MLHIPPQNQPQGRDKRSLSVGGVATLINTLPAKLVREGKCFRRSAPTLVSEHDRDDESMYRLSPDGIKSLSTSIGRIREKEDEIQEIQYQDYEYPFENIAFEGGGAKGIVYMGVMKVMYSVIENPASECLRV